MRATFAIAATATLSATGIHAFVPGAILRPHGGAANQQQRAATSTIIMSASEHQANAGTSLQEPMDRRCMLQAAGLSALGAMFVTTASPSKTWAASVDYEKVRDDIEKVIAQDGSRGPTLVRLAWHSSGTYDRISKTGGSQGGTMRFKEELADGANAGLYTAVEWMEPIKKKYPDISYGDLYTLAGVTAVEKMGGPKIKWRSGRKDEDVSAVPPGGRLPAADKGNPMATAKGLRDVFYRMGFNDREIVALSGAHALGRCHPNFSGYDGPWTPNPNLFSGSVYFKLLKNVPWKERKDFTPFQYQDPSGALMMLPSDIVLLEDKKFKKFVDMYADDDKLFFEDFAKAFSTLLELGTTNLVESTASA